MASIAAAGAAAAAIGMWYSQRRQPTVSEFTEPPTNWGEAMLRLHEVVRISWKEALSKLGVWRLDHLLAIRHLSNRDMSAEIAEDAARCGTSKKSGCVFLLPELVIHFLQLIRQQP